MLSLCVLGTLFLIPRASHLARALAPHLDTSGTYASMDILLGPHRFRIPRGFVRSTQNSLDGLASTGTHRSASLLLTWPDLSMPGDPASAARLGVPLPLIQVDLEYSPERENLRAQLDPMFRRMAPGAQRPGAGGLNTLSLARQEAPEEDLIAYDPASETGFVTRCVRKRANDKSVCHRTITPGKGLVIHYQFDQTLLPQWRALDQTIRDKVDGFRAL